MRGLQEGLYKAQWMRPSLDSKERTVRQLGRVPILKLSDDREKSKNLDREKNKCQQNEWYIPKESKWEWRLEGQISRMPITRLTVQLKLPKKPYRPPGKITAVFFFPLLCICKVFGTISWKCTQILYTETFFSHFPIDPVPFAQWSSTWTSTVWW